MPFPHLNRTALLEVRTTSPRSTSSWRPLFATDPSGEIDRLRARTWCPSARCAATRCSRLRGRPGALRHRPSTASARTHYRNLGASDLIMWWATQGSLPMIEGERHGQDPGGSCSEASRAGATLDALRPFIAQRGRPVDPRARRAGSLRLRGGLHAHRYPLEVMCGLMGGAHGGRRSLPGLDRRPQPARPRARSSQHGSHRCGDRRTADYLHELAELRRSAPADDFVSDLVAAQPRGSPVG